MKKVTRREMLKQKKFLANIKKYSDLAQIVSREKFLSMVRSLSREVKQYASIKGYIKCKFKYTKMLTAKEIKAALLNGQINNLIYSNVC